MVKETKKNNQVFYVCEACGFFYKDKKWAQKCEEWCNKHSSCNMEITKYAIQR